MDIADIVDCCGLDGGVWATIVVCLLYFALVGFARHRLIRDPFRAYMVTQLDTLQRELKHTTPQGADPAELRHTDRPGADELAEELRVQSERLRKRSVVWRASHELAAAELRLQAQAFLATVGGPEVLRVRALLLVRELTAAGRQGDADAPMMTALKAVARGGKVDDGTRLLLAQATFDAQEVDTRSTFITLRAHRKAAWQVYSGLFLIVIVAWVFGAPQVMAAGALGAFVSRLLRFVSPDEADQGDKAFNRLAWTALMAGPVLGALAAYGGVVLVELLVSFGALGDALAPITRTSATAAGISTATLGVAFLFGFSERLLDRVATQAEAATVPPKPTTPPTPGEVTIEVDVTDTPALDQHGPGANGADPATTGTTDATATTGTTATTGQPTVTPAVPG